MFKTRCALGPSPLRSPVEARVSSLASASGPALRLWDRARPAPATRDGPAGRWRTTAARTCVPSSSCPIRMKVATASSIGNGNVERESNHLLELARVLEGQGQDAMGYQFAGNRRDCDIGFAGGGEHARQPPAPRRPHRPRAHLQSSPAAGTSPRSARPRPRGPALQLSQERAPSSPSGSGSFNPHAIAKAATDRGRFDDAPSRRPVCAPRHKNPGPLW